MNVTVLPCLVRAREQPVELHADLALAAAGDLVVADLDLDAALLERDHHRLAQVAERVGRRDGEVPLLVARLVPEVRELLSAAVPRALGAVEVVEARVALRVVEAHVVEDEELGLGPHEARVAEARLLQVRLGLLRDVTRVARVRLLGDRVEHRAHQRERRALVERVHLRGVRVRDHDHVARVDRLPPADGRAVERQAVLEEALVQALRGDGRVLPHAGEVDELEIDELGVDLLRELDDVFGFHDGSSLRE
jgi:hypothetical protein